MRACFLYVRDAIFADRQANRFSMKISTRCVLIHLIEFYYMPLLVACLLYSCIHLLTVS